MVAECGKQKKLKTNINTVIPENFQHVHKTNRKVKAHGTNVFVVPLETLDNTIVFSNKVYNNETFDEKLILER